MKRLLLILFVGISVSSSFAQSKKYAICKVIETCHKVSVEFSDEVKYLGENYAQYVLYTNDNKKIRFKDGQTLVSYLTSTWGWDLSGNPVELKGGGMMWTLKHDVDESIANFNRSMEVLQMGERLYGRKNDDVY